MNQNEPAVGCQATKSDDKAFEKPSGAADSGVASTPPATFLGLHSHRRLIYYYVHRYDAY